MVVYSEFFLYIKKKENNSNSVVEVSCDLGGDLINHYYHICYSNTKKIKNENKLYYLSTWKNENKKLVDKFNNSEFMFALGSILIGWMITCDLVHKKIISIDVKEKKNVIIPTDKLIKVIDKNRVILHLPNNIPMIVPPKRYSKNKLGGYLLNDEIFDTPLIRKKWSNLSLSKILNDNIIYDTINSVSCTPYKINTDVLDFVLYNFKYFKDDFIPLDDDFILLSKTKLNKKEQLELDSYLSKREHQDNILGLANLFRNIPEIYFPVSLDFRGRLNCIPEYLNYQSSDLAKSLLLFSNPTKFYIADTKAINYLKLYGAMCFGLDKLSAINRIKWVDSNYHKILNFKDSELIRKAENKFLFTAFCFEFNRLINCINNPDIC